MTQPSNETAHDSIANEDVSGCRRTYFPKGVLRKRLRLAVGSTRYLRVAHTAPHEETLQAANYNLILSLQNIKMPQLS